MKRACFGRRPNQQRCRRADQRCPIHARAVGAATDAERAVDKGERPTLLLRTATLSPRASTAQGNAARIISTARGRGGLGGSRAAICSRSTGIVGRCAMTQVEPARRPGQQ